MKYQNVKQGVFLSRPNRFIAKVQIDGAEETVHVKNTGRCRELLIPGVTVYAEDFSQNMRARKTAYDLIAVEKRLDSGGSILINMDSQAPNRVAAEALSSGNVRLPGFPNGLARIKSEAVFGGSRLDFYVEGVDEKGQLQKGYIEVKGVTLEENGVARFPDAPTERGVKHVNELIKAAEEGWRAFLLFVVQMRPVRFVEPNDATHKAFGDALRKAYSAGVCVLAYDCQVTPSELSIGKKVPVRL